MVNYMVNWCATIRTDDAVLIHDKIFSFTYVKKENITIYHVIPFLLTRAHGSRNNIYNADIW